jgi:hypothetical protein
MPVNSTDTSRSLVRETLWFSVGILVLMAAQLLLVRAGALVARPLWFDECVTSLLANDPSAMHEIESITRAEPNTPGMFLLLRPLRLFGEISPVGLRAFSLACVCLALIGLYACLRKSCPRPAAIAGVLLVWSQPLIMRHAFEARYYAPMLMCTVVFALALQSRSRFSALWLALSSLALCMIHYFGILILVPMLGAHWYFRRPSLHAIVPALLGPVALIAWTPIFLRQRASFAVGTWIPPLSGQLMREFAAELMPASVVALMAVTLALAMALRPRERRECASAPHPLLALLAMPLILLVLTVILQPVLIARYAIVFSLGLATLLALVLRNSSRQAPWAICVLCIALSTINLHQLTSAARDETAGLKALARSIEMSAKNRPVFFADGRLLLPIYYTSPGARNSVRFLDTPGADPLSRFVHAVIHNVSHQYPGPALASPEVTCDLSSFLLVCSPGANPPARLFPGREIRKINPCLYEASEPQTVHAGE